MEPAMVKRLPIAAAWLLATAAVNGTVAYMMWGERGNRNRQKFKDYMMQEKQPKPSTATDGVGAGGGDGDDGGSVALSTNNSGATAGALAPRSSAAPSA
jgi:hypothetical protein